MPSKGKAGENEVASILNRLPKDEYLVLNDVIIPTTKGSSQIDHLVISVYGIFVIETKNYKGWIFGNECSEYWTQNIYGRKYRLYNPVLQNAGHVRALRHILNGYEPLYILPIVTFSRDANIKVHTEDACVIYWGQILKIINRFDERRFTWSQVNEMCDIIQTTRLKTGKEANKKHLKDVQLAKEKRQNTIHSGHCPICGGKLILRSGKHGHFYGCSNYPDCKYTHP